MPGPNIRVGKSGVSAITGNLIDMSFDGNHNLNKIARAIKAEDEDPVAHGLSYTPKILTMREIPTGKFGYGALCGVDSTNIYPELYTIGEVTDDATWVYVLIDPLTAGTYKKDMKGKPAILIGEDTGTDYDFLLHSGYDTFKVATTGTLTINASEYDPGAGGGTDTQTTAVSHGLGYVPMFAPFVEYETILEAYYQWNGSFYGRGSWLTGESYYTGEIVDNDSVEYWCIKTHTSSSTNEPGVGASWETYWEAYTSPGSTTYVNDLEDQKFGYGGTEYYNSSTVRFYATSTQIVLELERYCYPSDEPLYTYEPCPAETVTVDYTIFYNPAAEEFNLL